MTTTTPLPAIEPRSYEDAVVGSVVAFVGALGMVIGLLAPERTIEPSLGVLMLFFVTATAVSERRSRSRSRSRVAWSSCG